MLWLARNGARLRLATAVGVSDHSAHDWLLEWLTKAREYRTVPPSPSRLLFRTAMSACARARVRV
jgi:hypothetical protein